MRRKNPVMKALWIALAILIIYLVSAYGLVSLNEPIPDPSRAVSSSQEFVIGNVTVQARVALLNEDGDIFAGKAVDGHVLIQTVNQSELTPVSVSNAKMELLFENAASAIGDGTHLLPTWVEIPRIGEGRWNGDISLTPQSSGPCNIQLRATSPGGTTQTVNFTQPIVAESWGAYLAYRGQIDTPKINILAFTAPFIIFIATLIVEVRLREDKN